MKFVSARDLRSKSAAVWQALDREGELVVTRNGKPIAIMSPTDESQFEESLRDLRQARALRAVRELQEASVESGRSEMSQREIEAEITAARKERRR